MKTYDEILANMKEKYAELAGYEVSEYSDIDLRFKVLAGEIYKEQVNLEFIKKQMFVETATGEYLDLHATDRGLSRKDSVKATGKVKFSISAALEADLNIPAGTVVATSGSVTYQYVTDSDAVLTEGSLSVVVNCTAKEGGADSNAIAGKVNILVTTVPGIETVKNTTAFKGGTDAESDDSLRKRIIDSYSAISNGTNKAYYRSVALSVAGVTEASVVPKVSGEGTVDVYICNNRTKPTTALVNQVQKIMDEAREINVIVFVLPASPVSVELGFMITVEEGYDFNTVAENVKKAVKDYVNTLPIGEDVIGNHLGKVVLSVEGVYNYEFSEFYSDTYEIGQDSFAVVNTISVEEI